MSNSPREGAADGLFSTAEEEQGGRSSGETPPRAVGREDGLVASFPISDGLFQKATQPTPEEREKMQDLDSAFDAFQNDFLQTLFQNKEEVVNYFRNNSLVHNVLAAAAQIQNYNFNWINDCLKNPETYFRSVRTVLLVFFGSINSYYSYSRSSRGQKVPQCDVITRCTKKIDSARGLDTFGTDFCSVMQDFLRRDFADTNAMLDFFQEDAAKSMIDSGLRAGVIESALKGTPYKVASVMNLKVFLLDVFKQVKDKIVNGEDFEKQLTEKIDKVRKLKEFGEKFQEVMEDFLRRDFSNEAAVIAFFQGNEAKEMITIAVEAGFKFSGPVSISVISDIKSDLTLGLLYFAKNELVHKGLASDALFDRIKAKIDGIPTAIASSNPFASIQARHTLAGVGGGEEDPGDITRDDPVIPLTVKLERPASIVPIGIPALQTAIETMPRRASIPSAPESVERERAQTGAQVGAALGGEAAAQNLDEEAREDEQGAEKGKELVNDFNSFLGFLDRYKDFLMNKAFLDSYVIPNFLPVNLLWDRFTSNNYYPREVRINVQTVPASKWIKLKELENKKDPLGRCQYDKERLTILLQTFLLIKAKMQAAKDRDPNYSADLALIERQLSDDVCSALSRKGQEVLNLMQEKIDQEEARLATSSSPSPVAAAPSSADLSRSSVPPAPAAPASEVEVASDPWAQARKEARTEWLAAAQGENPGNIYASLSLYYEKAFRTIDDLLLTLQRDFDSFAQKKYSPMLQLASMNYALSKKVAGRNEEVTGNERESCENAVALKLTLLRNDALTFVNALRALFESKARIINDISGGADAIEFNETFKGEAYTDLLNKLDVFVRDLESITSNCERISLLIDEVVDLFTFLKESSVFGENKDRYVEEGLIQRFVQLLNSTEKSAEKFLQKFERAQIGGSGALGRFVRWAGMVLGVGGAVVGGDHYFNNGNYTRGALTALGIAGEPSDGGELKRPPQRPVPPTRIEVQPVIRVVAPKSQSRAEVRPSAQPSVAPAAREGISEKQIIVDIRNYLINVRKISDVTDQEIYYLFVLLEEGERKERLLGKVKKLSDLMLKAYMRRPLRPSSK